MITTYKIFHGLIDTNVSNFFRINRNNNRGHNFKIVLEKCRLNIRKQFYSQRVVNDWNRLPSDVVNAKDVLTFEKLYDFLNKDTQYVFEL